ncbi:MAG: hypothetical protein ACE5GJ_05775 [Gemmatimonadota bacterium]
MPLRYSIDPDQKLVKTVAEATLTDEDILAHKRALLSDPRYQPGMREISDVRGVTEFQVTPRGVSAFVGVDRHTAAVRGGARLAILADRDVVFGMARMYQEMTGGEAGTVGVFRTLEEACVWLGIDPPERWGNPEEG